MKRSLFLLLMVALTVSAVAQHKVYRDDKNMFTMTPQGDVTMISRGDDGQLKEQISFINEKGVAPMATTFNEKGLPSSVISNGEKINITYDPDGKTAYAQMVCKDGKSEKQTIQLKDDYSNYHAPGLIGWMDENLSKLSSNYGKQLNAAADVLDAIGTIKDINWTTGSAPKNAKWVEKLGGFLRSNKSSIVESVLIGSGVTILETWDDMKSVIEGGISRGLIVAKTLLKVTGNYNSWKNAWSDYVYKQLDDMDFLDHLTYEEYLDTWGMSDAEWEAYKKKMRAQWKEDQRKKVEENSKKVEGLELIAGDRERTRKNYTGNLIDPDKEDKNTSKSQDLVPNQSNKPTNGNLIDP